MEGNAAINCQIFSAVNYDTLVARVSPTTFHIYLPTSVLILSSSAYTLNGLTGSSFVASQSLCTFHFSETICDKLFPCLRL